MPTDAYWAVACVALAFCLSLALAYNINAGKTVKSLREALEEANKTLWSWEQAYNSRTEQLQATRIALREAQKNDHRDAVTGEYVRAS